MPKRKTLKLPSGTSVKSISRSRGAVPTKVMRVPEPLVDAVLKLIDTYKGVIKNPLFISEDVNFEIIIRKPRRGRQ